MKTRIRVGVGVGVALLLLAIGWRARATTGCNPTVVYTLEVDELIVDGASVAPPEGPYTLHAMKGSVYALLVDVELMSQRWTTFVAEARQ